MTGPKPPAAPPAKPAAPAAAGPSVPPATPSGAPPPPVPKTTKGRLDLAEFALRLRDEQLQARVVYVDPSLQTNAELDAITAQVVAELQQFQSLGLKAAASLDPQQIEIELIKEMREALEKMLSPRRDHFMRHKIENIQRKIANLYFTSEVDASADAPTMRTTFEHADEGLYHVLKRLNPTIVGELDALPWKTPTVAREARERFAIFQKQLVSEVLTRSRGDLERLIGIYHEVLYTFLMKDFRATLGEFAWEVIRESRVAHGNDLTYKIREQAFPAFRQTFEKKFLVALLASIQGPFDEKINDGNFRESTVRFASDPRIYAEICGTMCNSIYDFLHGEGFLDLPVDWKSEIYKQ